MDAVSGFSGVRACKFFILLAALLLASCADNSSVEQEQDKNNSSIRGIFRKDDVENKRMEIVTEEGKLRVFVVQLKQKIDDCAMPEDFLNRIENIIQSVKPHISLTSPNLFIFPEYTGFMCSFSGSRGSAARQADDVMTAFIALAASYLPQIAYYVNAYPEISYQRAMFLALTDAVWRPFHETFSYIAKKHRVYVLSAAVVADAETSYDEDDVQFFANPAFLPQDYVYLPVDENVYNQAVLYGPDGSIIQRTRKIHLSGDFENVLMGLSAGDMDDVKVFYLNGAQIGVTICLDTWYDEIINALVGEGMNFLVQLSANPKMWGHYSGLKSYWESDAWYSGIFQTVQEHDEILFGANSMLSGNLFEIPFDGQSSIIVNSDENESTGYIGTTYRSGFITLAPWVIDDPCSGEPNEGCRAIISERAESLLAGGAHENEYVETVVWADLDFNGAD